MLKSRSKRALEPELTTTDSLVMIFATGSISVAVPSK